MSFCVGIYMFLLINFSFACESVYGSLSDTVHVTLSAILLSVKSLVTSAFWVYLPLMFYLSFCPYFLQKIFLAIFLVKDQNWFFTNIWFLVSIE